MSLIPESSRQWWQKREPRERKILVVFFLFAIGAGLYIGVFEPIVGAYWEVQKRHDQADSDYRWLQDQLVVLNKLKAEAGGILPTAIAADDLKEEIEREFDKLKISADIDIVTQGDREVVEIDVRGVDGRKFMRWLENLSNKGRSIQALDLNNNTGKLSGVVLVGN